MDRKMAGVKGAADKNNNNKGKLAKPDKSNLPSAKGSNSTHTHTQTHTHTHTHTLFGLIGARTGTQTARPRRRAQRSASAVLQAMILPHLLWDGGRCVCVCVNTCTHARTLARMHARTHARIWIGYYILQSERRACKLEAPDRNPKPTPEINSHYALNLT